MRFGEFIKAKRLEAGMSQRELGRAIGASSGLVSLYEQGQVVASIDKAHRICKALGVTYTIGGQDGD